MLTQINPITTLGVRNLAKAKHFYEDKLGLYPVEGNDHHQTYKCGNSVIDIYETEYAGSNMATALSFDVGSDIESEVKNLKAKGITFEHYSLPETHLKGDIHMMDDHRAAWFKDPDGNILCLHAN